MIVPNLVVCSGTRCQLNKSEAINNEFKKLLIEYDLLDKIYFYRCGCFGLCQIGPTVSVISEKVGKVVYVHVKLEDARRIIEETLIKGNILEDLLLENNKTLEMKDSNANIK